MQIASGLELSHNYFMEYRVPNDNMDDRMNPDDWSSIFIPCVPASIDDSILTAFIETNLQLGLVKRIDRVNHKTTGKPMAFIHFEYWMDYCEVKKFRRDLEKMEYLNVYGVRLIYTTNDDAITYNNGNLIKYISIKDYWGLDKHIFIRMMINKAPIRDTELNIHQIAANADQLKQKVIQLTENLENVVKENAMLREQMDTLLSKPTMTYKYNDESPPALSLDDLVTDDDDKTISVTDTDSTGYPAFHPDEFAEYFTEDMEYKIILDTAIANSDYDTIVKYFLNYEIWATDQPCSTCVFEEFCDDNNISGKMKNELAVKIWCRTPSIII